MELELVSYKPGEEGFEQFLAVPSFIYPDNHAALSYGFKLSERFLKAVYVLKSGRDLLGRFAFYENPHLKQGNKAFACIGSYECVNDKRISAILLGHAKAIAEKGGYDGLIGPMEGSTWNDYRFSLKEKNRKPFSLEPQHHIYYNDQFMDAGFELLSSYVSSEDRIMKLNYQGLLEQTKHFEQMGLCFRTFNKAEAEKDLAVLGRLSIKGFERNFLYSPVTVEEFVAKYSKAIGGLDPDLILISEDKEANAVAMAFGLPDQMDKEGKTFIIKTVVREKDRQLKGIGEYLCRQLMINAEERGYTKVIHAFMRTENASVGISNRNNGIPIRDYGLYQWIFNK